MKILIGNDHAGYEYKKKVIEALENTYEIIDCGSGPEKCDYPLIASKVCLEVLKEKSIGILICGTGIGMSISANKFTGIRCALVTDSYCAKMARMHNDANVIAFGARVTGIDLLKECLNVFIATPFEGGRHQNRLELIEKNS